MPGHEVVGHCSTEDGTGADGAPLPAGTRVVLAAGARAAPPAASSRPVPACAAGHVGNCGNVAFGHIRPGLQTGFCADTGGGWSTAGLVAHASQLYAVPDALSDADAVTVEPVACAVHAVLGAPIADGDVVAVLGRRHARPASSPPPCTTWPRPVAAPRRRSSSSGPSYAHQQRLARELGATRGAATRPAGPGRAPAARARCPSAAPRA